MQGQRGVAGRRGWQLVPWSQGANSTIRVRFGGRPFLVGSTVHVPQWNSYQTNESAQVLQAMAVEALLVGQTTQTRFRPRLPTSRKLARDSEESFMHASV